MERYFLVSYTIERQSGFGHGNLWFSLPWFPSNEFLKSEAIKLGNGKNAVINNIYEFKSEEDFNSFTRKEV